METPSPTVEHEWLHQLLGNWKFEAECIMGPDQPPSKSGGTQATRLLGSLWTLGEMESYGPDGLPMQSIITLGFDPAKHCFAGTFVASCMTHLWLYNGQLDASRKVLTLDTEGPSFTDDGTITKYQDIIKIIDQDHYLMTSQFVSPEGSWVKFMSATYSRIEAH